MTFWELAKLLLKTDLVFMHILVEFEGRILETSTKFILALTKEVNLPEFLPTLQHFLSHFRDDDDRFGSS